MPAQRPKTGLTIREAFARWADPEDVAKVHEYPDAASYGIIDLGAPVTTREKMYSTHEARCRAALMALLKDGRLLASGISNVEENEDRRKVIHPSMWDVLDIHVIADRIAGSKRDYQKPEFFEPSAIPLNLEPLPTWVTEWAASVAAKPWLSFEANYSRVFVGDEIITCGPKQSEVLRLLDEADRAGKPWCPGKQLLAEAGSDSANMGELFKHDKWRGIIESNGTGSYRLVR